jgi:hypothetical protein
VAIGSPATLMLIKVIRETALGPGKRLTLTLYVPGVNGAWMSKSTRFAGAIVKTGLRFDGLEKLLQLNWTPSCAVCLHWNAGFSFAFVAVESILANWIAEFGDVFNNRQNCTCPGLIVTMGFG